jgi:hypothetical protein
MKSVTSIKNIHKFDIFDAPKEVQNIPTRYIASLLKYYAVIPRNFMFYMDENHVNWYSPDFDDNVDEEETIPTLEMDEGYDSDSEGYDSDIEDIDHPVETKTKSKLFTSGCISQYKDPKKK